MTRIRFKMDCDSFAAGHVLDCDPGVADAFVNWRHVAEYVADKAPEPGGVVVPTIAEVPDRFTPDGKSFAEPPADKMMRARNVAKK